MHKELIRETKSAVVNPSLFGIPTHTASIPAFCLPLFFALYLNVSLSIISIKNKYFSQYHLSRNYSDQGQRSGGGGGGGGLGGI